MQQVLILLENLKKQDGEKFSLTLFKYDDMADKKLSHFILFRESKLDRIVDHKITI